MSAGEVKALELEGDLNDDEVWRYMHTKRPIEDMAQEVALARRRVQELGQPAMARRFLSVERLEPDGVVLEEGVKLESSGLRDFFQGADAAMLLGVTIGPRVEAEVNSLFTEGEAVMAVLLDAAGSALLRRAVSHVHREAFLQAQKDGLITGPCLSPGGAFWDITGQRTIFGALPMEEIGVRLLESCFMSPRKSSSRVLPMGRNLVVRFHPEDSHCRFCTARYCLARRE